MIEALKRRPVAVVAGSRFGVGISSQAAFYQMYRMLPIDHATRFVGAGSAWLLGSYLRRTLGEQFAEGLIEEIDVENDGAIERVAGMPVDLVLTTTFGDSWKRAFEAAGKIPQTIVPGEAPDHDYDAVVMHLFGHASQPESMVLTAPDLHRVQRETDLSDLVRGWWGSRVFVFVGFSAGDRELQVVLEQIAPLEPGHEHFLILSDVTEVEREELEATFGLTVLSEERGQWLGDLGEALRGSARLMALEAADLDDLVARAAEDPNDPSIAARFELLEYRLRRDSDYERLVDLYLARMSVAEDARSRREALSEIASIMEENLGDPLRGFHAMLAAYREVPDAELWPALARLADASDAHDELAEAVWETRAYLRKQDRAQAALLAARIYRDELNRSKTAADIVEAGIALDPSHPELRTMQLEMLRENGNWRELARALEASAEVTGLSDPYEIALERARLYRDKLEDAWAAIGEFRTALRQKPDDQTASTELAALLVDLGETRALRDLMQDSMAFSTSERFDLLKKLAGSCEERGDLEEAARCWELVRLDAPNNAEALETLDRIYTKLDDHSQLRSVLLARVGSMPAGADRAEAYRRLARAYESEGDIERAANTWEWVLFDEESASDALSALQDLYKQLKDWSKLLVVARRRLEVVPEKERASLLVAISEVHENELGDLASAIDLCRAALRESGSNPELEYRLIELLERAGRPAAAAAHARRLAASLTGADKAKSLERAGALSLAADDRRRAVTCFKRAIEAAPDRPGPVEMLAEIRLQDGALERAALLFLQAATLDEAREIVHLERAAGCFTDSGDHSRAADAIARLRSLRPATDELEDWHLESLGRAKRHFDQIDVCEALLEDAIGRRAEQLLEILADAYRETSQIDDEIAAREKLVGLRGESFRNLQQLITIALERGCVDTADRHTKALIEAAGDQEQIAEARFLMARCAQERGRNNQVRKHVALAREADPFHKPSLELLIEISQDRPEVLVDCKQALLLDASDEEKAELLVEIGDLFAFKLYSRSDARDSYEAALSVKPDDHLILHRCLEMCVEEQEWDRSFELLDRLIATEEDLKVRARYRSAKAGIYAEELGDTSTAIDIWFEALEDNPLDERTIGELGALLRASENWSGLVSMLSRQLSAMQESPDMQSDVAAALWSELARICIDKIADIETAVCALEVAIRLQPHRIEDRIRLAKLYKETGRLLDAVEQHQSILDLDASRLESYRALTELYDAVGDPDASDACANSASLIEGNPIPSTPMAPVLDEPIAASSIQAFRATGEDPILGRILSLLVPATVALQSRRRRRRVTGRRSWEQLPEDTPVVCEIRRLADVLGVRRPDIYADADASNPVGISVGVSDSELVPILLVSSAFAAKKRFNASDRYAVAESLFSLRRDYIMRAVENNAENLGRIIDAVFVKFGPDELNKRSCSSETAATLPNLIDPLIADELRERLGKVADAHLPGAKLVERWLEASDRTAGRAALAVVGDLPSALRVVERSSETLGGAGKLAVAREVARFSCSPKYWGLRRRAAMRASERTAGKGRSVFREAVEQRTEELSLDQI